MKKNTLTASTENRLSDFIDGWGWRTPYDPVVRLTVDRGIITDARLESGTYGADEDEVDIDIDIVTTWFGIGADEDIEITDAEWRAFCAAMIND